MKCVGNCPLAAAADTESSFFVEGVGRFLPLPPRSCQILRETTPISSKKFRGKGKKNTSEYFTTRECIVRRFAGQIGSFLAPNNV